MSKIPTPKSIPSPKSVTDKKVAGTAEHEELLMLFWQHKEKIVDVLYSPLDGDIKDAVDEAWIRYQDKLKRYSKVIGGYAKERRSVAGVVPDWERLLRNLNALIDAPMPPFPEDFSGSAIVSANLAHPLTVQKTARGDYSPHDEVIGFVDVFCAVGTIQPDRIDLVPHIDRFNVDENREWAMQRLAAKTHSDLNQLAWSGNISDPASPFFNHHGLAVDIRPQLPPLGQLLRELKTIESYLPSQFNGVLFGKCSVLVVTNDAPDEIQKALRHEGITILTRKWIEANCMMHA